MDEHLVDALEAIEALCKAAEEPWDSDDPWVIPAVLVPDLRRVIRLYCPDVSPSDDGVSMRSRSWS